MTSRKRNQLQHMFDYRRLITPFIKQRTRAVVNPFVPQKPKKDGPVETKIYIYDYDSATLKSEAVKNVEQCYSYIDKASITWINMDGINKTQLDKISSHFGIHQLYRKTY